MEAEKQLSMNDINSVSQELYDKSYNLLNTDYHNGMQYLGNLIKFIDKTPVIYEFLSQTAV